MKKQILICIDDSPTSSQALLYVSHLFGSQEDVNFLLLHVHAGSAAAFPEPEDSLNSLTPDRPTSAMSRKGDHLLQKARQKLEAHGIHAERITTCCQPAGSIASAIHQFGSHHLVDAIVVARRGVGIVGELLLGSVSSALFDRCRSTPLWVIDGNIQSERFLIPVDGTPNSMMAIDHLAHIFSGRTDVRLYLFHARSFLSSPPVCRPEMFYDRWGKEWCDTHLSGNGCMFTGPTHLLTEGGVSQECIFTLPEPTTIEESTAIISAARKNNCGTIVIGRRPESEVKSIFGGVSKRTIRQAENLALWVIG
ncbi:universal stress protein [Desulfopila aestuarii]|uniref:Nucleotide-binding universal stress protein, UspA family n=1 Tax=Desulfopila aestuarii DSM 18488 TaxID=1121416 RepID=A0A1M7YDB2_9BACT|nr:universal stress protein [Desulfopila aestuarii]SHO50630.1 Nucleotide-binding universal stress protein, UspA family [Desulfopila aestuarii DSM 18488]